jgi:hypothetical protein
VSLAPFGVGPGARLDRHLPGDLQGNRTLTPRRTAGNAFLPPGLHPVLRRKGRGEERGGPARTWPLPAARPAVAAPRARTGPGRPKPVRHRPGLGPVVPARPGHGCRRGRCRGAVGRGRAAGCVAARPRIPADRQGVRPSRQRRRGHRFRRGEPCPPIGPVARTPCHHPAPTSHRNVQTAVPRDPSRAPARPGFRTASVREAPGGSMIPRRILPMSRRARTATVNPSAMAGRARHRPGNRATRRHRPRYPARTANALGAARRRAGTLPAFPRG